MRFGTTRSQVYDAQKVAPREVGRDRRRVGRRRAPRNNGEKVVDELDKAVSDTLLAIDQLATPVHPGSPGVRVPTGLIRLFSGGLARRAPRSETGTAGKPAAK